MPRIITGVYLVIGMVHVISRAVEFRDLDVYTKPLLMPLLIYLLYRVAEGHISFPRLLLAAALIFSWVGDLLLMGAGELFFLGGLVSFLVAQILYAITFYKSTLQKPVLKIQYFIPIGIYGIVLLSLLLPAAGKLGIAIIIYAIGLLSMIFVASTRTGYTTRSSYQMVLAGAILFVISDSLIAVDKFYTPIMHSTALVMAIYIPAQLLLVWGVLKHNP